MNGSVKLFIRRFWPLFCILLLAGIVRLLQLGQLPLGFHNDEVFAGYIGRYIFLHNGIDITGHRFPLFYDMFGDFRPIGIFLLSGVSTFLFGVNEFAVRFPSTVFGILTVIPLYLLCVRLLKSRVVALLAGLFLAVSPWHVVLSRATSEGVIGLFFFVSGMACFSYFIDNHSLKTAGLGVVSFGLSYFFYHSFRVLVPLIIVPFYFYPKLAFRQKRTILAVFFLFLCLTMALSLTKAGSGRLSQVLFTKSPDVTNRIALFTQGEGSNHLLVARIFHNKAVVYTREFLRLYSEYFSPSFLFSQGGFPDRYVVPDVGLFPWIFVVLLGIGIITILTKRSFANNLLLWLVVIAPLPAAVTTEDAPNVHRAICLIIPLIIASAMGGASIINDFYKRKSLYKSLIIVFALLFIVETVYFWHQYSIHEKGYKSFYRNDMFREMVKEIAKVHSSYDVVYVPEYDGIPLYYLFYSDTFNLSYTSFSYGGIIKKLDNIQFIDDWCPTRVKKYEAQGKQVLYVNKGDCPGDPQHRILEIMSQHDGARAFQFVEERILAGE